MSFRHHPLMTPSVREPRSTYSLPSCFRTHSSAPEGSSVPQLYAMLSLAVELRLLLAFPSSSTNFDAASGSRDDQLAMSGSKNVFLHSDKRSLSGCWVSIVISSGAAEGEVEFTTAVAANFRIVTSLSWNAPVSAAFGSSSVQA